jgi:hypothetical protein
MEKTAQWNFLKLWQIRYLDITIPGCKSKKNWMIGKCLGNPRSTPLSHQKVVEIILFRQDVNFPVKWSRFQIFVKGKQLLLNMIVHKQNGSVTTTENFGKELALWWRSISLVQERKDTHNLSNFSLFHDRIFCIFWRKYEGWYLTRNFTIVYLSYLLFPTQKCGGD